MYLLYTLYALVVKVHLYYLYALYQSPTAVKIARYATAHADTPWGEPPAGPRRKKQSLIVMNPDFR
jgi:hypothetical protein